MSKKFVFCFFMIACLFTTIKLNAQEYGNVYLDLKDDDVLDRSQDKIFVKIWDMAQNYIADVKEYDDLLVEDTINKDFSDDIKNKYKGFDDNRSEEWEGYVRKGVKTYRIYKFFKKKITDWMMNVEFPIVTEDDQYETGEKEEYIKSDKPLVIKDFKKIVAYSGKEKDVLATQEKHAKEQGLETPSERIVKYKKLLVNKDWKGLLNAYFGDVTKNESKSPSMYPDGKDNMAKAIVMPKYNYTDKNGNIEGVIFVEVGDQSVLLMNKYGDNQKTELNFEKSENIKDVDVKFVQPQQIENNKGENMLVYVAKFPIYFTAKVIDKTKDIFIKPSLNANICSNNDCKNILLEPELTLQPSDKTEETLYSAYVISASMNVPDDFYKDWYKFGDLVWEKRKDGTLGNLRLDIKTSDVTGFDIFIIGDETKYFSRQRLSIDGKKVTARFDLEDITFDPSDKELSFWVSINRSKNYIHKQKVKKISNFDVRSGEMSLGVLWFAFLGGILLNLMPCVFPVLFLKLLGYTKIAKLNVNQIRQNFVLNIVGILTSFAVMALILSAIKLFGRAIGWGMQFQNTYFLATIIWMVMFFLYYVLGLFDINIVTFSKKMKQVEGLKTFEFFSGVFMVLLSTPCMAPYLGTAFGIALAGNVQTIILTVMVVGLGLAAPYILLAIFPKIAFYFPKPGKWLARVNNFMWLLLFVTIIWLLSILVAQTNISQIWHWIVYAFVMMFILYFGKCVKFEINKIKDKKRAKSAYKKLRIIFGSIILCIVALSFADVGYATKKRQKFVDENYETKLDLDYIENLVKNNNQVLVKVGADWCLTCKYNDFTTLSIEYMKDEFKNNNVVVIDVDWTEYQPQVLKFMQKFGRSGLPFYVLFSKRYPDGVVLPEILNDYELMKLVEK